MPIAITKTNGGVSIMYSQDERELEKWKSVHRGEYVSHSLIAESDIPKDRTDRHQWIVINNKIAIDKTRIKERSAT